MNCIPAEYVGLRMAFYAVQNAFYMSGVHQVVGIEEEHPWRLHGVQAAVACGTGSGCAFGENSYRTFGGVVFGLPLAQHFDAAVGAGVVDQHGGETRGGLLPQAPEGVLYQIPAVMSPESLL